MATGTPTPRTSEEQIRHIRARDQEDDPNGAQEYPQYVPDVSHEVLLQGT